MNIEIIIPVAGKTKQFYNITGQQIVLHTDKNLITSPLINGGVIVCGIDN